MTTETQNEPDFRDFRYKLRLVFWTSFAAMALYVLWGPTVNTGEIQIGYTCPELPPPRHHLHFGLFEFYTIEEAYRWEYDPRAMWPVAKGPYRTEDFCYFRLGLTVNATFLLLGFLAWKLRPNSPVLETTEPLTSEAQ